jgi:CTP:molybdopterin cytidylyltransferase MocA
VVFDVKYKKELLAIGDGGAKVVVDNHVRDIVEVHVDSVEVLTDIDTPQDYQNAIGKAKDQH